MERLNLGNSRLNTWFFPFVMLVAIASVISPVLAVEGTVTISYRGAGGYTIGDTIIFDGRDKVSNTTLLKISGPGLPEAGVPVFNLNGIPGSGNTVPVNADGSWRLVWDSANVAGVEKLMTVRYTITAFDQSSPEKMASTSILLKKPGFYVNPLPAAINTGDYLQVSGRAEQDVTYVTIEIADSEGRILHTFVSPVSGTGSFSYGFRADMPEGRYTIRISNPALKDSLTTVVNVVLPTTSVPVSATTIPVPVETSPFLPVTTQEQTSPVESGTPVTPSVPVSSLTSVAGLLISGLIVIAYGNRKQ